jgi:Tfp pilus assembly PilM family ATPase
MTDTREKKRQGRKVPGELLVVDIGASGSKVVRVKKAKEGFTVLGADILPVISLNGNGSRDPAQLAMLREMPKPYKANYIALTVSGEKSVVRLLSLPGQPQSSAAVESHLREHAGLEGDYRLSYSASPSQHGSRGRMETKYLAVAMPEHEAQAVLSLVPAGPPAPWSLELSGLGVLNAFLHGPGRGEVEGGVGVIEGGAHVTFLALFNKGRLVLVRKFDFGCDSLVTKVEQQMGVDREVAEGIIADGSFDISGCVKDVMAPFLRQLSISRDFVERQEKCRIGRLYISGGMSLSHYWVEGIKNGSKVDVQTWNPFDGVKVAAGAISEKLKGQETRFAAALGAAYGAYEGS